MRLPWFWVRRPIDKEVVVFSDAGFQFFGILAWGLESFAAAH